MIIPVALIAPRSDIEARLPTCSAADANNASTSGAILPAAMLFLRSPGGISHDAAESVLAEDVEASLQVGREFLLRLAQEIG